MRILDLTLPTPAGNLALDEAILEGVNDGTSPPTLRLWNSPIPFVVLGVGQRILQEVNLSSCHADGLAVLRRCSAGGCVLQGPGCLNYALMLPFERWPELRDLRKSYCAILGRVCDILSVHGVHATIEGTSDLVSGDRKFSGNAQKRKRDAVLHHGTLLYGLPQGLSRYLLEPVERPAYRGARDHQAFVAPIPISVDELKLVVTEAFADTTAIHEDALPSEWSQTSSLIEQKYSQESWTARR